MLHLEKDWRHRHNSISPCLRALYSLEGSHGEVVASSMVGSSSPICGR